MFDHLTRWKNYEYITILTTKTLYTSNEILPRAFELSKIHKSGFPFRLIIFSIDCSFYALASFLHKIIINTSKPFNHIDNNFQFVDKLKNTSILNKHIFISLDVSFLFTGIINLLFLRDISAFCLNSSLSKKGNNTQSAHIITPEISSG